MGSGIAAAVAKVGLPVTLADVDDAALARGFERVEAQFRRLVRSGQLDERDARAARDRISGSTKLDDVAGVADYVIETVVEDLATKTAVLRQLDAACRPDVVLASNTSQFSISRLAAATGRPDRVIGSHWFNPPTAMPLIELVRGVETSDQTLAVALELAGRFEKQTIICQKDTPGFITSRLIALLMIEAARIVDEGIASVEDVNSACVLGFGHAQGPLDTADASGLDTLVHVADALREQYGDRFLVPQNLRALYSAGHFGRKTGRGFSLNETKT